MTPQGHHRVQESPTATGRTILVVEDNKLNMKLFCDVLEAHGHRAAQTGDGLEALKLARQLKPDLIIMDIQLPEISGVEVTKWIKNEDALKAIPVIAVTAFAMKGRSGENPGERLRRLHGKANSGEGVRGHRRALLE